MRALSAEEVLRVWERGLAQPPVARPLAILAQVEPDATVAALARLPLGQRERRLLDVRAATFGRELAARGACPACGETMDFAFLASAPASARGYAPDTAPLHLGDFVIQLRSPNTTDLLAAAGCRTIEEAQRLLANRCMVTVTRDGVEAAPADVPDQLLAAVSAHVEAIDPDADSQVQVQCPSCASRCDYPVDVGAFFWAEIEIETMKLLRDVHRLASAYGWHEADILSMSPARRQAYLELLP